MKVQKPWDEVRAKQELQKDVSKLCKELNLQPIERTCTSRDPWGTLYESYYQGCPVSPRTCPLPVTGFTWMGREAIDDFIRNLRQHLKGRRYISLRQAVHFTCETLGTTPIYYIYCRFTAYDKHPDA